LTQSSTSNEISLYQDELATASDLKSELVKLTVTFPEIDNNYIIILADRIKEHKFTKQRLHDAIAHVVDTCHYKRPMIAEIVSFDRKIKTYSYLEMTAMCNPHRTSDNFELIVVDGRKRWIEK
jgi:hypothetical protein